MVSEMLSSCSWLYLPMRWPSSSVTRTGGMVKGLAPTERDLDAAKFPTLVP